MNPALAILIGGGLAYLLLHHSGTAANFRPTPLMQRPLGTQPTAGTAATTLGAIGAISSAFGNIFSSLRPSSGSPVIFTSGPGPQLALPPAPNVSGVVGAYTDGNIDSILGSIQGAPLPTLGVDNSSVDAFGGIDATPTSPTDFPGADTAWDSEYDSTVF